MPRPYPKEFREGAIALARGGRPVSEVAKELGIAESCLRNWLKQDQLDRRERDDGLTSAYGLMFWLRWNRLPGSYFRFTSTRRS